MYIFGLQYSVATNCGISKPENVPKENKGITSIKGMAAIIKAKTKMKKIMLVCMFAMATMFVSANNEKGMNKDAPQISVTSKKVGNAIVWDVTVRCPNGNTYYSCCYSSYNSAYYALQILYLELC